MKLIILSASAVLMTLLLAVSAFAEGNKREGLAWLALCIINAVLLIKGLIEITDKK